MTKKFITFPAILPNNGIRTMSDGGVRLTLDTNEMPAEDFAEIATFKGSYLNVAFAAQETAITDTELEIPDVILEDGEKSPSQRLRAVLYRVWEVSSEREDGMLFEVFYRARMDMIITHYKNKLP